MAHIQKFKLANTSLGYHFDRSTEHHSNENIDPDRTKENYVLRPAVRENAWAARSLRNNVNERISDALGEKRPRKDAVAFFSLTATAPHNLKPSDADAFMTAVYGFAIERFGDQNVMPGYVHADETIPHIHIPVVPVTEDRRLCFGDVVPRDLYKSLHKELNTWVDEELGYHVNILLDDDDKRGKALSDVPQSDLAAATAALDAQLAARSDELKRETEILNEVREQVESAKSELSGLEQRFTALVERLKEFVHYFLLPPFDKAHKAIKERGAVIFFNDLDETEQAFFNEARDIAAQAKTREKSQNRGR